jgi:hypothetical protein
MELGVVGSVVSLHAADTSNAPTNAARASA